MVVVEVRQGTLGVDGRGWSWLRSGRKHWAWMIAVEVRQDGREHWAWMIAVVVVEARQRRRGEDEEEEEEREDEEDEATNIKSNNPHLAGGEL